MEIKSRVFAALADRKSVRHGLESFFVDLKDGTGAKLFWNKAIRDHSHKMQLKAYKSHIAPKPLEKFFLDLPTFEKCPSVISGDWYEPKFERVYGYLTEIVKSPCEYGAIEFEDFQRVWTSLGFDCNDVESPGNLGRDSKGHLVAIDFGPASTVLMNDEYHETWEDWFCSK